MNLMPEMGAERICRKCGMMGMRCIMRGRIHGGAAESAGVSTHPDDFGHYS